MKIKINDMGLFLLGIVIIIISIIIFMKHLNINDPAAEVIFLLVSCTFFIVGLGTSAYSLEVVRGLNK